MILLEPAHKILHTTVKFKRRTISVTPFYVHYKRRMITSVLPTNRLELRFDLHVTDTCSRQLTNS
jgi:hypothetical protein